jgi:hypothetical protein
MIKWRKPKYMTDQQLARDSDHDKVSHSTRQLKLSSQTWSEVEKISL